MRGFLADSHRPGATQMAIDQAMVERAGVEQCLMLRTYGWSEPTLSLGYFQSHVERQQHPSSGACSWVRRGTGGGAILHHHDWTYSIAMPETWMASERAGGAKPIGAAQELYEAVHDAIVAWLRECGWSARKWSEPVGCSREAKPSSCPFLCFERRNVGDVVVGNVKVMGSAQRRQRGVVLQHGSLLLRRSEFAPSLAGLENIEKAQQPGSRASQLSVENLGFAVQAGLIDAVAEPYRGGDWERYADIATFLPAWNSKNPGKFGTLSWNMKR